MKTKEDAPERFQHLYDTPIYMKCSKGSGFYKYKIKSISIERIVNLTDEEIINDKYKRLTVYVYKTSNPDMIPKTLQFVIGPGKGRHTGLVLSPERKLFEDTIWTFLPDFYKFTEQSDSFWGHNIKRSAQYQTELIQVKSKYPEEFL